MSLILIAGTDRASLFRLKKQMSANVANIQGFIHSTNTAEAVRYMSSQSIKLVVFDLDLERDSVHNQDFLWFSAWLFRTRPRIFQIVLCNPEDLVYVSQSLRDCQYEYLQKPAPAHILINVVNKALHRIERVGEICRQSEVKTSVETEDEQPVPGILKPVLPNMKDWYLLLKAHAYERVGRDIRLFLSRVPAQFHHEHQYLEKLLQDFKQLLYSELHDRNIAAHELMTERELVELLESAGEDLESLNGWVQQVIFFLSQSYKETEHENTPYLRAVEYIRRHVMEPVHRDMVASYAGVNPDYLSLLFKKNSGQGISQYIINQKMEIAADLLMKTKLPVCDIASGLGYSNFSHFSSSFKKCYAHSPVEFRSMFQEDTISRK